MAGAPARAAGGEGSSISRILAKLGLTEATLTDFFSLQMLLQELQIPLTFEIISSGV